MRYLGVDLAWGETNETGVVALDEAGTILAADWRHGTTDAADWICEHAGADALCFIDAPLVVTNPPRTMRTCERRIGNAYGRWRVSANSSNIASAGLGGVKLREELERRGWRYDDGFNGPPPGGLVMSECYPYTTLVGAHELGYDKERPTYKRRPRSIASSAWRAHRASVCDDLVRRLASLKSADPPVDLMSHPTTGELADTPSPVGSRDYKHREDLIDAVIAAWTAALWSRHGLARCQVLGEADPPHPAATIIAPCRPEQRL